MGSGELLDDDRKGPLKNERSAFAVGASLAASKGFKTNDLPDTELVEKTTRLSLGRFDPLATLSVMLSVDEDDSDDEEESAEESESEDEDEEDDDKSDDDNSDDSSKDVEAGKGKYVEAGKGKDEEAGESESGSRDPELEENAYFQCTVRYVERDGNTLVTRVYTHQLPIADGVADFLESVDDEVIPVVLGREAVYRAMYGREISEDTEVVLAPDKEELEDLAYEAQQDLDATVQRISGAFRLLRLERGMSG